LIALAGLIPWIGYFFDLYWEWCTDKQEKWKRGRDAK
jgi:hypothetical protein